MALDADGVKPPLSNSNYSSIEEVYKFPALIPPIILVADTCSYNMDVCLEYRWWNF